VRKCATLASEGRFSRARVLQNLPAEASLAHLRTAPPLWEFFLETTTMSTATKRKTWGVAEWAGFAERARDVQDRLWQAVKAVERIPGYRVAIADLMVQAMNRINYGLVACENLVEHDCGVDPMRILYGVSHARRPRPLPESRFRHLPDERPKRTSILAVDVWRIEGRFIKEARAELFLLIVDLGENFGKARIKRARDHFKKADRTFTSARAALESLLRRHHPELHNATTFFFGGEQP
jgi:hypothetical protein